MRNLNTDDVSNYFDFTIINISKRINKNRGR